MSASFNILQIELSIKEGHVELLHLDMNDVQAHPDAVIGELNRRATAEADPRIVDSMTYQDDEGDWCTLVKETLPDALSFAQVLDGDDISIGRLCVRVQTSEAPQSPTKTDSENTSVHDNVICDGCECFPIVGRRFRADGEDFDLCENCMERWNASHQAGSKTFTEITAAADTHVQDLQLPAEEEQKAAEDKEEQAYPPASPTVAPTESFGVLQIELLVDNSQVSAVHLHTREVLAHPEAAINALQQRASEVVAPGIVKSLTYQDDEGDWCTLTKDTLTDALSFAEVGAITDTVLAGCLQVRVLVSDAPTPESPAIEATAEDTSACSVSESDLMQLVNKLACGCDFRALVPKLAGAALQVIQQAQEPALYSLIEVLQAFQEGKNTAADLPMVLPLILEVAKFLPHPTLFSLAAMFHKEAIKTVAEMKQEACSQQNEGVEVHLHVVCDGCGCSPMVGRRYKSMELDDFDLCEQCFAKEPRSEAAWAQVQSATRADVVSSYYAIPATDAVHHGIVCDRCDVGPIVGQRFHAKGEDFDLCGHCMQQWQADPHAPAKCFEEMLVTTATQVAPAEPFEEEVPVAEAPENEESQQLLAHMSASDCRRALEKLLTHSSGDVRTAVAAALQASESVSGQEDEVVEKEEEEMAQKLTDATEEVLLSPRSISTEVASDDLEVEVDVSEEQPAAPTTSTESEAPEVETPLPAPCAAILKSSALILGIEAVEDMGARGDITSAMQDVVSATGAQQAYCIGRMVMATSDSAPVPACAKFVVVNNGQVAWPETAAITLVAGHSYDFQHLQLGALQAGEAAEIVMDLTVPREASTAAARSVWGIVDTATTALLGPLAIFEVIHAQE